MNTQILIDHIVRQTMVLIAQVATSGGARSPLANVADRVFLELARELEAQGLSRKVSADMFGVALRSYRRRIQRLTESVTEQGRSLWSAVLDYVPHDRLMTRGEVLQHFSRDDESQVRSILSDLCESGFILKLGHGAQTAFRAASEAELVSLERATDGFSQFAWLLIYREGPMSRAALAERMHCDPAHLDESLSLLTAGGMIQESNKLYSSREVVLEATSPVGWEAAMLDHFRALVLTLCNRLRGVDDASRNGGSTYTFDVAPHHPLAPEVYGALARMRQELSALRARVEDHNRQHPEEELSELVTTYIGQLVQAEE